MGVSVDVRVGEVGGEAVEADVCVINGATYVGEGGDFGESGGGFLETAATGGDLDELRVKFGG